MASQNTSMFKIKDENNFENNEQRWIAYKIASQVPKSSKPSKESETRE